MSNDRQHWIVSVCDSINKYREVATGYFDGTESQAMEYFRSQERISRYVVIDDNEPARYQITMTANPIIIQDA